MVLNVNWKYQYELMRYFILKYLCDSVCVCVSTFQAQKQRLTQEAKHPGVVMKYHFPSKKPGLLREIADPRSRTGNVHDELGTSYHTAREQGSYQKVPGSCQKDSKANLKGARCQRRDNLNLDKNCNLLKPDS